MNIKLKCLGTLLYAFFDRAINYKRDKTTPLIKYDIVRFILCFIMLGVGTVLSNTDTSAE